MFGGPLMLGNASSRCVTEHTWKKRSVSQWAPGLLTRELSLRLLKLIFNEKCLIV